MSPARNKGWAGLEGWGVGEETFKALLPAGGSITQGGGWDKGGQFLPNCSSHCWALCGTSEAKP